MNLVAKEYLAAQDPDDPGVLVLSQFAGAAKELDQHALIVNPHETDAVATALKHALEMSLTERRERHAPMLAHLLEYDIKKWAEDYLSMLVDGPPAVNLLAGLRALFGVSSDQAPFAVR
jgi:trehalose 6-phosphate synthase